MGTDLLTKLHDARVQAKRDSDTIARLVGERNSAREQMEAACREREEARYAIKDLQADLESALAENARLWAALSTQAELQIQ